MVSEKMVYYLFRWGQGFIDAAISVIHQLTTPLCDLYPDDSFLHVLFNASMWFYLPDLSQYSLVELLIGPGMALLVTLAVVRLVRV